jgi:hypothetical protein
MTNQHPITPPRELVREWYGSEDCPDGANALANYLCTQAAQWGADQELEACCEWFICDWTDIETADKLRAARRPKPPSLKEQALETLHSMRIEPCVINGVNTNADLMAKYDILRRALEALDD